MAMDTLLHFQGSLSKFLIRLLSMGLQSTCAEANNVFDVIHAKTLARFFS